MSISHEALEFLRQRPNPFENLVRPQGPDDRFLDLHVPELLAEPRELLLSVIDAYRLTDFRRFTDLRDSRVVTILGRRGSGKTHLLEAIVHRGDSHRQLLVRPSYFEPDVPFNEYLLAQLVNALLTDDPVRGGRPFDAIAQAFSRLLLRNALANLGPVERLLLTPSSGLAHYWHLWFGGEKVAARVEKLTTALASKTPPRNVAELALVHGFDPALLTRLVEDHVERSEIGKDVLSAIRRQLYKSLARAALLGETDAFIDFLQTDYKPAGSIPVQRIQIVRQLVAALVELCAMKRLPVIVAFDNLEALVAPKGQLDPARGAAFLHCLAQATDTSRGLLFLLFAEEGLYRMLRAAGNSFALNRIDQGVPMSARGPVDVVELRPPNRDELQILITTRLAKQLQGLSGASALPPAFPFEVPFLQDLHSRTDQELRNKLLRLRDEYARVVFPRKASEQEIAPEPPELPSEFNRCWTAGLRAAAKRLANRDLVTLYHDLHAGLRQLIQHAGASQANGLEFASVQAMNTADGHGTYSQVTVVDWRKTGTNGDSSPAFRICVGMLVAGTSGMRRDLRAKFLPLPEPAKAADKTLILWPSSPDQELPAATRKVWDDNQRRFAAVLHHLSAEDVHKLLALPEWVREVRGNSGIAVPERALGDFLKDKCQVLLSLIGPAQEGKALRHAH